MKGFPCSYFFTCKKMRNPLKYGTQNGIYLCLIQTTLWIRQFFISKNAGFPPFYFSLTMPNPKGRFF